MAGRFDLEERAAADRGTEGDEQLGEDRDRVSLRLGGDRIDDLAREPVIGRQLGWRGPPVRRR
jgi:hypothetical protein